MELLALNGWMAGFVDGEGCLTISKQIRKNRPSPQWRPYIGIANTHKGSLEIFQQRYGGVLRFNVEKRQSKTGVKWSDSWNWYCQQTSIPLLLHDIMPHLIVKKRQAEILILFMEHAKANKRPKGGRNADGKFKGSSPLKSEDLEYKESLRTEIQSLNSGKRFKQTQL